MPWSDKNKPQGPWGAGGSGGQGGGSGGSDGGSPWGRPAGGGGSGGGKEGPDLEEQMRRMQERFRARRGGGGRRGGGSGRLAAPNIGPLGVMVIGGIALLAWLSTSVVVVDPTQQAVVFRFGKWQTNFGPGLHFHLPAPIERHVLLAVERREETRIGAAQAESLMLTQDENIVDLQFSVFWKISTQQPQNFLLNVKDPRSAVAMVSESVMREVVGKRPLQELITTERDRVQDEVSKQIQALLNQYNSGIEILSVQIDKSTPPAPVIDAFNDVNIAEQDAETVINEATREANRLVPEARGLAQQILQQAEGYRDEVVANALGEASRFDQVLTEYRNAPRVTRERMYLETMERVLERSDKLILDQQSGAVPYLPLERARPITPPSGGQQ